MTTKMKLKPMLAAIISLAVLSTPVVVKADTPTSAPGSPTSEQSPPSPFANLNLSQQQQQQISQIQSDTDSKIQQVLTSNQQDQLAQQTQAGKKRWEAFKSLNLSQQQKQQIKQLRKSAKQQMAAVLTPEQRQELHAKRHQHEQEQQTHQ